MSIWSRIAEALAAAGNSLVAYLSGLVAARAQAPEKSIAFTIGMIALSAKMAKADGVVTPAEIEAFKRVFVVAADELPNVARVFNLAKQDVAGYETYARQISRLFKGKHQILEDVLDGLFHIGKADGSLHERELAFVMAVAGIFGFSDHEFGQIRARHVALPASNPYAILGLEPSVDDAALKKAWRKLVRENHPDRHIAAGMPAEAVKIATDRLSAINAAYDRIAKERGL